MNKFKQNTKKRLNFILRSKGKLSQLNNQIFNNLGLDSKGMIRLTSLEIYNSFFNITAENNEFELHKNLFDDFSFTELKQEVEEKIKIPHTSTITNKDLQGTTGPNIIKT